RPVEFVVVFPRAFPHFPHGGVDHIGIRGIDLHIGAAGVFVLSDDSLPALPRKPCWCRGGPRPPPESAARLSIRADGSRFSPHPSTCRFHLPPKGQAGAILRRWKRKQCLDQKARQQSPRSTE